jgi:hypothetical protein
MELLTPPVSFPTKPVPLAALSVRVDELALRLGYRVQSWVEDGLGPARGFCCRLQSGRVFCLEELELAIKHQGAKGPVVWVDDTDMVAVGIEHLVEEVSTSLGLTRADLTGVAHPE